MKQRKQQLIAQRQVLTAEYQLDRYTIAILQERVDKADTELASGESEIAILNNRIDLLDEQNKVRRSRWVKTLKRCAKIVKSKFDDYARSKGATGVVDFNYNDQELKIHYQTDSRDANTAIKDTRNLSGGEKSFATFAFLMALGQSVRIILIITKYELMLFILFMFIID